jgi:hypothetical protein
VILKKKFIYMLTLQPKGDQTKYVKLFLLKIFSFCHLSTTPGLHLELRISPQSFGNFWKKVLEKFETALMGYSGAGGKLTQEKNLKSKISWRCPFKMKFLYAPVPGTPAAGPHSHSCCVRVQPLPL